MAADFYIVADMNNASGQPLTAANASSDPSVQRMVKTYKDPDGPGRASPRTLPSANVSANRPAARFGTNISAQATGPLRRAQPDVHAVRARNPGNTMNVFLGAGGCAPPPPAAAQ